MLERLQRQLSDIYQTDAGYDVRDFLVTDPRIAAALSGGSTLTASGETLLMKEEEDGLSLSLYLQDEILERLEAENPASPLRSGRLDDLCKVIEGLSHFHYVVWRASRDRSMSLLELELQAEVDKFVSTMHFAQDDEDTEMLNGLHGRLFDNVRFHEHLSDEQLERYRAATEYAARFCRGLRRRILSDRDGTLGELRRFFRLPLPEKISHIHSRAWRAN